MRITGWLYNLLYWSCLGYAVAVCRKRGISTVQARHWFPGGSDQFVLVNGSSGHERIPDVDEFHKRRSEVLADLEQPTQENKGNVRSIEIRKSRHGSGFAIILWTSKTANTQLPGLINIAKEDADYYARRLSSLLARGELVPIFRS